jgi:hypothetical protein
MPILLLISSRDWYSVLCQKYSSLSHARCLDSLVGRFSRSCHSRHTLTDAHTTLFGTEVHIFSRNHLDSGTGRDVNMLKGPLGPMHCRPTDALGSHAYHVSPISSLLSQTTNCWHRQGHYMMLVTRVPIFNQGLLWYSWLQGWWKLRACFGCGLCPVKDSRPPF